MTVKYINLTPANFSVNSLDGFVRRQTVTSCWRKTDGGYALKPVFYTEDWSLSELRELSARILNELNNGAVCAGALCGNEVVGFALVKNELFGSKRQYVDLAEFYVSQPYRRKGVGKALFQRACEAAKSFGAKKLYVSAHSAEESIAAYKSYGCTLAKEVNAFLAEKEPCDLQLEYELL